MLHCFGPPGGNADFVCHIRSIGGQEYGLHLINATMGTPTCSDFCTSGFLKGCIQAQPALQGDPLTLLGKSHVLTGPS